LAQQEIGRTEYTHQDLVDSVQEVIQTLCNFELPAALTSVANTSRK